MPRIKYVQTINRIVMKLGEYASKYASATCKKISPDMKYLGIDFFPAKSAAFQNRKRKSSKRKASKNVTDITDIGKKKKRKNTDIY